MAKKRDIHAEAMRRFDKTVPPQIKMRRESLAARRFVEIPGAMWEGEWGEQFENSIRVEVPKIGRAVRKIETDYRENRIVPDFRPDGPLADQDTADTLDGLLRADSYRYKAQQARDNAFSEAIRGGFGAYRLLNVEEDALDSENENQRINPGLTIVDADQCVFFDPDSRLYDKSDAKFAFVLVTMSPEVFEETYGSAATDWPTGIPRRQFEWFAPDVVRVAEYYIVEEEDDDELILTHMLTDEEMRLWADEVDAAERVAYEQQGWSIRERTRKRRTVCKYVLSGAEIVEPEKSIAGDQIPIVPVYGQRTYVDGMERFKGHVQDRMDAQRLYNAKLSKLAEVDALAPREVPIFAPQQIPAGPMQDMWRDQNIKRYPYLLANPLTDENGQIVSMGPIGKVEPPQPPAVTVGILQIANNDLQEDDQDGADEVKANTSAEAMDIAAARVDAKSGIYLDNMRQSIQREAEIYLSMSRDVYFEAGRTVETMSEDGDDGEEVLREPYIDPAGVFRYRNDLQQGKYKVIASVTEATATRRDKTVKSALSTAEIAMKAGDNELALASILTAVSNQDGEGMDDLQRFARKKGLSIGLFEPNEEEAAKMAEQQAPPDPMEPVLQAQAENLNADTAKKTAEVAETEADTELKRAKTVETLASAKEKQRSGLAAIIDKLRFGAQDRAA